MYLLLLVTTLVSAQDLLPGQEAKVQVTRMRHRNGTVARTVILPKVHPDNDWESDNFVLISDSSGNKTLGEEPPKVEKPRIRRRKKKKKPTGLNITQEEANYKDPKFLNLFTIVRFPNDDCEDDGGTCYHQMECEQMGGRVMGLCARGYGVCCAVETKCGSRGVMNGVIFIGGSQEGACSLTIEKGPCTKQMRLDFINLELDAPMDGTCMNERLLVTGQNKNFIVPVICGSNSGQHMYLDVDDAPGPVMVSVISPFKKEFRIKVTQICDGNDLMAPRECLQYYTEPSGMIESFNYVEPPESSSYMNNLNYAICIKKQTDMCTIVYNNVAEDGEEFPFEVNNVDLDGSMTVPPGQAGAEVFNCPEDYVSIASVRLCGQKLNDASNQVDFTQNYPITDRSNGPFMLSFVTNGDTSGRGFRLRYSQNLC